MLPDPAPDAFRCHASSPHPSTPALTLVVDPLGIVVEARALVEELFMALLDLFHMDDAGAPLAMPTL